MQTKYHNLKGGASNKMENHTHKKNNKKKDGKFHSKNIKHDPQAQSARAVFGLNDKTQGNEK